MRDEDPCNDDQRPNDVGDDKGMLEEDTESLSLDDYDLCSDFEREEFEGSSFTLGGELLDVTIMTSLPTKWYHIVEQAQAIQSK